MIEYWLLIEYWFHYLTSILYNFIYFIFIIYFIHYISFNLSIYSFIFCFKSNTIYSYINILEKFQWNIPPVFSTCLVILVLRHNLRNSSKDSRNYYHNSKESNNSAIRPTADFVALRMGRGVVNIIDRDRTRPNITDWAHVVKTLVKTKKSIILRNSLE